MQSDRLNEAFAYASRVHQDQTRKGGDIPYLGHLMGVASNVIEYGGNEDEVIAALLHDAVEDQGGMKRLREIEAMFGPVVADIVKSCSDNTNWWKPPWTDRKQAYLKHLETETSRSDRLVSAADKLYNIRTIIADYHVVGEQLWKRFAGGKAGTVWYYRSLADTFLRLGPARIARELDRRVRELESLVNTD